MEVRVDGDAAAAASRAKDVILGIIGQIGIGGGTGYVIEYTGEAIRALSMEGRMTVCNMSIEAGARAGMIAPDETTFAYLEGRQYAPKGADWERGAGLLALAATDAGAEFDKRVVLSTPPSIDAARHLGHQPRAGRARSPAACPTRPTSTDDADRRADRARAGVHGPARPARRSQDIALDRVFIGSCTNSRIEDLRAAAAGGRGASRSTRTVRAHGRARARGR